MNNIAIGINAGFDLKDDDENKVRIGNFSDEEVKKGKVVDCFITKDNKLIIKKYVLEFLGIPVTDNQQTL